MTALIVTIHIIVCVALILIVLLQTGKGADMGAVFGGAGSQTLFGSSGASTFLGKLTTAAAIVFMLTSLTLAYISKSGGKSVVSNIKPAAQQQQTSAPLEQPTTPGEPVTMPEQNQTESEIADPVPEPVPETE